LVFVCARLLLFLAAHDAPPTADTTGAKAAAPSITVLEIDPETLQATKLIAVKSTATASYLSITSDGEAVYALHQGKGSIADPCGVEVLKLNGDELVVSTPIDLAAGYSSKFKAQTVSSAAPPASSRGAVAVAQHWVTICTGPGRHLVRTTALQPSDPLAMTHYAPASAACSLRLASHVFACPGLCSI
jgi:hypothetical protein